MSYIVILMSFQTIYSINYAFTCALKYVFFLLVVFFIIFTIISWNCTLFGLAWAVTNSKSANYVY